MEKEKWRIRERGVYLIVLALISLAMMLGKEAYGQDVVLEAGVDVDRTVAGNGTLPYGAAPFDLDPKGNSITLNGARVNDGSGGGDVCGAKADNGSVTDNRAVINADSDVAGNVYGGWVNDEGETTNNRVEVSGGIINQDVIGGWVNNEGEATNNRVEVSGGIINGYVMGGDVEDKGDAANNTVVINSGNIGLDIYGGWVRTGNATNNSVMISGGSIEKMKKQTSGQKI